MRVIQIAKPNAPFELVERPTPEPGPRPSAHQGRGLRHLP